MKVLLQPCSGKRAMNHFEDTIVTGVPIGYLEKWLDDSKLQELRQIQTGNARIWGFVPGKNTKESGLWDKLQPGDLVLFYAQKSFFYLAEVLTKAHNKKFAEELWGTDDDGRTWEYMFFIKEGKSISLPYDPNILIKIDGEPYELNHVVQGATLLSENNSLSMIKYLEEKEGASFDEDVVEPTEKEENDFKRKIIEPKSIEEAEREIKRLSAEVKDAPVRERIKTAKMLVRNPKFARLVKEKVKYVCEVCGEPPFLQKNGLFYAEAHHKSELAKTKIDNPEDMICVCPTCHKVIHFGTQEELNKRQTLKDR